MTLLKPMRAATLDDLSKLHFPVFVSPKLDGIRCNIQQGIPLSKKLKPIPNLHVQRKLSVLPDGLDGELMVPGEDFNGVQSAIMSREGKPRFEYHLFDYIGTGPFSQRREHLRGDWPRFVKIVPQRLVRSLEEVRIMEQRFLDQGYEGLMARSKHGIYKHGKCTQREHILFKLKRFLDAEAKVIGFEEEYENLNAQFLDELGRAKRSSHKENKRPKGTLGALIAQDLDTRVEFRVGTGLTAAQRKEIWENQTKYKGAVFTYKYQGLSRYGVPRTISFKGWRRD